LRLAIPVAAPRPVENRRGDSIAWQGGCGHRGPVAARGFEEADLVTGELFGLTTLGGLVAVGASVNLEPARVGDALGCTLVIPGMDGVAKVVSQTTDALSTRW